MKRNESFWIDLKVAYFLAKKQIKHASLGTNALIVSVMLLTLLNLIVISGILIGIIAGASLAYRNDYSGDFLIKTLPTQTAIKESPRLLKTMSELPEIVDYSARYVVNGQAESGYKERRHINELGNRIGAQITGIDPEAENRITNLSNLIVEGEYLKPSDEAEVLVGSDLLSQYARTPELDYLEDVEIGSKILLLIGNVQHEVTVKGFVQSKIGNVGLRIYMNDRELRKLIDRNDLSVDEVAVDLRKVEDAEKVKAALTAEGLDKLALLQTWKESQGDFFDEIEQTFSILGSVIGSIGLAVASITIFIVIFINAIARKKYIGILKGIGIKGYVIEISYIFQALFYALIGTIIGLALTLGVIQPYLERNPINFPFSEGILVTPLFDTVIKIAVLFIATLIAGYIPAKLIVRKNTLDSILGR